MFKKFKPFCNLSKISNYTEKQLNFEDLVL